MSQRNRCDSWASDLSTWRSQDLLYETGDASDPRSSVVRDWPWPLTGSATSLAQYRGRGFEGPALALPSGRDANIHADLQLMTVRQRLLQLLQPSLLLAIFTLHHVQRTGFAAPESRQAKGRSLRRPSGPVGIWMFGQCVIRYGNQRLGGRHEQYR